MQHTSVGSYELYLTVILINKVSKGLLSFFTYCTEKKKDRTRTKEEHNTKERRTDRFGMERPEI